MRGLGVPLDLITGAGDSFRAACLAADRGGNDFRHGGSVLSSFVMISLACLVMAVTARGEEPPGKQELPTIKVESQLYSAFGKHRAVVDCGSLQPDQQYRILLRIHNPTAQALETNDVAASRSCVDIKQSSHVIPAQGYLDLSLTASTVKKSNRANASWRIDLFGEGNPRLEIQIRLEYKLAGLIQFTNPRAVLNVQLAEEHSRFMIPMLITAPVQHALVKVLLPDDFTGVSAVVTPDDQDPDRGYLVLDVNNGQIPMTGLAGAVRCVDPESARESEVYCVVQLPVELAVYPAFLRLIESDNDDQSHATAIVTVDSEEASPEKTEGTSRLMIDAHLDGIPLALETQYLSNTTARVKVRFNPESLKKLRETPVDQRKLNWLVRSSKGVFRTSSYVKMSE